MKAATKMLRLGDASVVMLLLEMHLDPLLRQGADVPDVVLVTVQERVHALRVRELFDLGLVLALPKFPPHAIQHHFGQCRQPRVLLDLSVVESDPLGGLVVSEVLPFFFASCQRGATRWLRP